VTREPGELGLRCKLYHKLYRKLCHKLYRKLYASSTSRSKLENGV